MSEGLVQVVVYLDVCIFVVKWMREYELGVFMHGTW